MRALKILHIPSARTRTAAALWVPALWAPAIFALAVSSTFAQGRWYKPKPGTLEFRDALPFDAPALRDGIPSDRGKYKKPNGDTFYLRHEAVLSARHIQYVHLNPGEYQKQSRDLTLYMTPAGMEKIYRYTRANRIRYLAFLINGELVAAPLNRRPISFAMSMQRFRGKTLASLRDALVETSAPKPKRLLQGQIAWLKQKAQSRPRDNYLKRALVDRFIYGRRCDAARVRLLPLLYNASGALDHSESLVIGLGSCYYIRNGMPRARRWYKEALQALAHRIARDPPLELILRTGLARLLAVSGDSASAVGEYERIIRLAEKSGRTQGAFVNELRKEIKRLKSSP